ncbi:glutamate-1-semialdehyde 2,1-aminomutase, partial [Candidatus Desantisbacteria bacterium]|nr:glutamate-1-semialdehyde 2,1-aminomutase [Candidatus Desantisbacteria bacterium]
LIPGGVNSPVRAFKAVGGNPVIIKRAAGSKIYDVDGNEYIDYVLSWGPMILGHADKKVINAVKKIIDKGMSFGAPTEIENTLAHLIIEAVPSIEKVRMVNSGTEATMSAIRLARGYTGRKKILKFDGCYHGHADSLLVKAGSGAATLGIPDSLGVPSEIAALTITVNYNNLQEVKKAVTGNKNDIAAIIVEPVCGNMGVVLPEEFFLKGLRELCSEEKIVLIFDEVMTGFRVSYGGAQEIFKIKPDLTTLGKIIGGGMPVGAYGGKKEIMDLVAPLGGVYQAGTLSGNPAAMTAGIETIKQLKNKKIYSALDVKTKKLCDGMKELAGRYNIPFFGVRCGSMFCGYFTDKEVTDYASAKKSNIEYFKIFFANMMDNGINLAPSQFEAGFMSFAHTDSDINKTIEACEKSFRIIKRKFKL